MALLIQTKGRGKYFIKGDKVPALGLFFPFRFWNPLNFLGGRISIRFSEIESITPVPDAEVNEFLKDMKVQNSKLIK